MQKKDREKNSSYFPISWLTIVGDLLWTTLIIDINMDIKNFMQMLCQKHLQTEVLSKVNMAYNHLV